ncbi:MAG: hypothetical protein Ct9H90mP11_00070 [Acidimicrobiales bacterium]|nr:MAG: hypothetical protein Ct9H90mP11_00070 [Acidimicrobiales bacterium]
MRLHLISRFLKIGIKSSEVSDFTLGRDIFDPQISPNGNLIAYVSEGQLRYVDEKETIMLLPAPKRRKSFGFAEFIAAEEMGGRRGYWWSPDNDKLLVTSVDKSDVLSWHILKSSDPSDVPAVIKYPKAGTKNSNVELEIYSLDGEPVPINWNESNNGNILSVFSGLTQMLFLQLFKHVIKKQRAILRINPKGGFIEEIYRWNNECWLKKFLVPRK